MILTCITDIIVRSVCSVSAPPQRFPGFIQGKRTRAMNIYGKRTGEEKCERAGISGKVEGSLVRGGVYLSFSLPSLFRSLCGVERYLLTFKHLPQVNAGAVLNHPRPRVTTYMALLTSVTTPSAQTWISRNVKATTSTALEERGPCLFMF